MQEITVGKTYRHYKGNIYKIIAFAKHSETIEDMKKKDSGIILNVASIAAFQPGPLMATYYATKSYVYQLTAALNYEQKKKKTKIR